MTDYEKIIQEQQAHYNKMGDCNYTEPTGRPSLGATLTAFLGAAWVVAFPVILTGLLSLCGGCRAFYENAGSRTVVGSVTAPIDISDASDNIAAKLLYSMDGASVYTAKDSLVKIHYSNIYTNSYIGCVTTRGTQDLTVEIEPLATDATDATDETDSATNAVPVVNAQIDAAPATNAAPEAAEASATNATNAVDAATAP